MATPVATEWDDIPPTSNELFGGDFFGDELMEMYSGENGLALPVIAISAAAAELGGGRSCSSEDFSKHPGILVAMNAAAMDWGLDFLSGMSSDDVMSGDDVNDTSDIAGATVTPVPSALPLVPVTRASASATAAAKRSIATRSTSNLTQRNPPKKRKLAGKVVAITATITTDVNASAPNSKVPAKVASRGGIKVNLPPTALIRVPVSNSASKVSHSHAVAAQSPGPPPSLSKIPSSTAIQSSVDVIPNDKITAVSSTVVAVPPQRIAPSTLSTLAPTKIVGKTPDVQKSTGFITSTITGVKVAQSEAEFKDMAAAAVSCFMQSASTSSSSNPLPTSDMATKSCEKIDTSTAHINALTSQNWVTACGPPIPEDAPSSDASTEEGSACDKTARTAHRATLTQEQRAKQNRDRNREHARNTRLRKKAYVEELKRTLTELVTQRDATDVERRLEAQRNREQREVRFRVIEEFLKLRGRNEPNTARWIAILENGFAFVLPRTNYRRMVDVDKSGTSCVDSYQASSSYPCSEQVLRGAAAVIEDSAHLATFLKTLGGNQTSSLTSQVQIVYACDRKCFFMDGNVAFMDFQAVTIGAVENEISFKGQMKALFSPASNKLISIDMTFDTMSIVQQLEGSAAARDASELLDSLQMPQMITDHTEANGPVSVSSDDGSERSTDGGSRSALVDS